MQQCFDQLSDRRISFAIRCLFFISLSLSLLGCNTTPTTSASTAAWFVKVPRTTATNNEATNNAALKPLPPNTLNIEPPVIKIVEDDLFERIRTGFVLTDLEHPSIDQEQNWYANHPTYLDRTLTRAEPYLYYIVSELEARNMPSEFALLPLVESAFNPTALSRAKAAGLWQFIPSTGLRYGLKQNIYYDGRRDIIESTRAALDYLQFLNNEFSGDWLLALAAYNAGEMTVARAVARNQARNEPTDFFSLSLPRETRAYVPKLLALRRIIQMPERFGLEFGQVKNEPYFVSADMGGQMDLTFAASLAGISTHELLALNPGFKKRVSDPHGPHRLLLPVTNAQQFLEKIASLPDDQRIPTVVYRVRRGDSLHAIARRHGMTVAELRTLNQLTKKYIKPGQELLVQTSNQRTPVAKTTEKKPPTTIHYVRNGETLSGIAKQHGTNTKTLCALNSLTDTNKLTIGQALQLPNTTTLASTNAAPSLAKLTYTVRPGDTLSSIAVLFRITVKDITAWNHLRSAHAIKIGQRLILYVDDSRRLGG